MDEPLTTVEKLAARLPFDMDEMDEREAGRAIEELSDEARSTGSSKWTSETVTPRPVVTLVLKAAARHMKNYEGYTVSRAGDETVQFSDRGEAMGDAQFNAEEKKRLREYAGNYRSNVTTVGFVGWQTKPSPGQGREGYVTTTAAGEKAVPLFADDEEPW